MDTGSNIPQDAPDEGQAETRPLGLWLRAVDALIDREIDAALRSEAIDRRDWRLLKALDGTADAAGVHDRMARKPRRIEALAYRGWTTHADGEWTLTDDGRDAVERLTAKTAGVRERVAGAVAPDELATTVASLEAIARAFGWEEGQPLPHARHDRRPGHRGFGPQGFGHRGFEHDGLGPHGHGLPDDDHEPHHGFPGRPGRGDRRDAGQDAGVCGHGPHHGGRRHGRHGGWEPWARGRHDAA